MIEESQLELVVDYHVRIWVKAFRAFHLCGLRLGLKRWGAFVRRDRVKDERNTAAAHIQRIVRGQIARCAPPCVHDGPVSRRLPCVLCRSDQCARVCVNRRGFYPLLHARRRLDRERVRAVEREQEAARNARAKAAGGVTMDGYHFFETPEELEDWGEKCTDELRTLMVALGAVTNRMAMAGFAHWRKVTRLYKSLRTEAPDHIRDIA